jgi:hypothetical protein
MTLKTNPPKESPKHRSDVFSVVISESEFIHVSMKVLVTYMSIDATDPRLYVAPKPVNRLSVGIPIHVDFMGVNHLFVGESSRLKSVVGSMFVGVHSRARLHVFGNQRHHHVAAHVVGVAENDRLDTAATLYDPNNGSLVRATTTRIVFARLALCMFLALPPT